MLTHRWGGWFSWYCEGCRCAHSVKVDGTGGENRNWTLSGTEDRPTIHPSFRSYTPAHSYSDENGGRIDRPERTCCHLWLRDGVVEFLDDSASHQLRGKRPLVHFPSGYGLMGGGTAP